MADKKDEEKAYEVKDKRRVNPDGSLKEEVEEAKVTEQPAEAKAENREAEQPTEQPSAATDAENEMPPPNIFEMLQFMTGLLAENAWQFMGLHLPPGRKEPVVDMAQAKLAIDVIISIADKLHPHIDEESRRAIRGMIADLQLNFVQHNK